jgi:hypothetical protein
LEAPSIKSLPALSPLFGWTIWKLPSIMIPSPNSAPP